MSASVRNDRDFYIIFVRIVTPATFSASSQTFFSEGPQFHFQFRAPTLMIGGVDVVICGTGHWGACIMRKAAIFAAALMSVSGPAQAQSFDDPQAKAVPAPQVPVRQAAIVRVSLIERKPAVARGEIAVCADLAAQRALNAKAIGAGYAAQDRVLDLTFVLCMAGPQTAD